MFFKKKNSSANQKPVKSTAVNQPTTEKPKNPDEKTFKLEDLVKACDHYAGTEDETFLVKLLADCLYNGTNGIERNLDMAYDYYSRLSNLDRAAGICGLGRTNIAIGLERDDRFRFSLGVNRVYEAYTLGDEDAKKTLEIVAESGMFDNITTFNEMVHFCANCNDIK